MPTTKIKAPDGSIIKVNHPQGASQDQIYGYANEVYQSRQSGQAEQPEIAAAEKIKTQSRGTRNKQTKPDEGPISKLGLARQVLQGLSFGGSDELGALISAPINAAVNSYKLDTPFNLDEIKKQYNETYQTFEDERNQFKAENPKSALAAELAGGLATGALSTGKILALKGVQKLKPAAQAALVGATEGGTYGFLSSDQGERGEGAAIGAGGGAVLGPAVQSGVNVGRSLLRPLGDRLKNAIRSNPDRDAAQQLASVLAREGFESVESIPRVGEKGLDTLADASQGGRFLLEGLANDAQSPGVRRLATETFESRNAAQPQRILESLEQGAEIPSSLTVKQAIDATKIARANRADPLYAEARSQSYQPSEYFLQITNKETGSPEAYKALVDAEKTLRTKRAAGQEIGDIDIIDEFKKSLDDTIGNLYRNGLNNKANNLRDIKNKILDDVDQKIPEYKQARSAFAGDSALIDAAEQGKRILREDAEELRDIVGRYGDSEKEFFRLGAKKAIKDKLALARQGNNSSTRIMQEINLEKIKNAFPSDQAFQKFKSELQAEAKLYDTSQVLANSTTALRNSVQRDLNGEVVAVSDALGNKTADIAANAIKALLKNRTLGTEARLELGKILLTPIDQLPQDIVRRINTSIIKQLPAGDRQNAITFISQVRQLPGDAPLTTGAVSPAVVSQSEARVE